MYPDQFGDDMPEAATDPKYSDLFPEWSDYNAATPNPQPESRQEPSNHESSEPTVVDSDESDA